MTASSHLCNVMDPEGKPSDFASVAQNQERLSPKTRGISDRSVGLLSDLLQGNSRLIGDGEIEAPFDLILHRRGEHTRKSCQPEFNQNVSSFSDTN